MSKKASIRDIAEAIDAGFRGNADLMLDGIGSLESAGPQQLSFLSSSKFSQYLDSCAAGAIILKEDDADKFAGNVLITDDPYLAYAKSSAIFDPRPRRVAGIHPSAVVAEEAVIHDTASIGANAVIGDNVVIGENSEIYPGVVISENSCVGDNCLIYANVTIYSNVRIGCSVIIHSGTAIGSDGFGFAPTKRGWVKIHQIGGVVIGDNVEIGACSSIDRGALGDTVIHPGVIIDNQVHLAHNVEVGENTAIAGCVGVAGSAKIGKNCTFAGAVMVNGHITIADNCHFKGGTIVTKNTVSGVYGSATPIQEVKKWRKSAVRFGQLDDLAVRLKRLEKSQKSEN